MNEMNLVENYENALHDLNDVKNRESDYGQINALQGIVNRMAELVHIADAMANHIAAAEGKTGAQVWTEFKEKI